MTRRTLRPMLSAAIFALAAVVAGYVFMRLGAEPWMWPHGWLNVPLGMLNTLVLITSSITTVMAWAGALSSSPDAARHVVPPGPRVTTVSAAA